MTAIYRTTLKVIVAGSLLLQASTSNCRASNEEKRFHEAIEYWTETLCTLQKTRTFVFHGIFTNSTRTLREFFDVLLRMTTEYCNTVVVVKTYNLSNFHKNHSLNTVNLNTRESNRDTNEHARMSGSSDVERKTMRNLVSMLNLRYHKWNTRRYWRKNDDHYTDIWTMNVVFLGDSISFDKLLDSNAPFQWNSREHLIVLAVWNDLLAELNDRKPLIDKILRKLWLEYRVQNVLFDEPLSTSHEGFNLYSFNPFVMNSVARGQLERVDGTSKRRMLHWLSTMSYRRTNNFDGFPFNVSIFDQEQEGMKIQREINPSSIYAYSGGYEGPSGILLGVLAKRLNFTVNVIEPKTDERYGHQMKDGTFSGAVGDVAYHRAVASFASFFIKKYVNDMSSMEFTTTVGFDQVCVIVPKAAKIPKGLRMLYIFEPSVWLCIMFSYILVYLTRCYVQAFSLQRSKKLENQTTIRVFFTSINHPILQSSTLAERCLLLSIFFCSITLVGVFNGILFKCFITDMFYSDINSLAELDASGLPIGFLSYSTTDLFGTKDNPDLNPVLKRLQKKLIHEPNATRMAAFNRNVSGLVRNQYYPFIRELLIDKSGTRMVHRVTECPAKFHLACLLPSNSFLRERINIMIGRLNQAGLPTLWRTRSVLENALKIKVNIQRDHKHEKQIFVAFQLSELQLSFFILGTGLLSSIIVFFNEKGWLRSRFRKPGTDSINK